MIAFDATFVFLLSESSINGYIYIQKKQADSALRPLLPSIKKKFSRYIVT